MLSLISFLIFISAFILITNLFIKSQKINYELTIAKMDEDFVKIKTLEKHLLKIFIYAFLTMFFASILIITFAYFYSCSIGKCW